MGYRRGGRRPNLSAEFRPDSRYRKRPPTIPDRKFISSTTAAGLTAKAELDRNKYAKGIRITDAQMGILDISRAEFHGD